MNRRDLRGRPKPKRGALSDAFRERFEREPTIAVRAPGRVNLIGEHIDYCGLSVLPMALTQAIHMLVAPRVDDRVRILNVDPRFGEIRFRVDPAIEPGPPGHWENYAKAAAQALARREGASRGFDAVLASNIPVAMGLSSSSALTVATGLAVNSVNRVGLAIPVMGEAMAQAERYVGTQGGGMDQAISLGAVKGSASRVDFDPLRLSPVPIPSDWRFVVASSLVSAEKSGTSQQAYNERTRDVTAALDQVWSVSRGGDGDEDESPTYKALIQQSNWDLLSVGAQTLPPELFRRFRHVVTEAGRVEAAIDALTDEDMDAFGALMNASHESLRDDYEVSGSELDTLVELARGAGAAGARLTGAGFGGCVVALTHKSRLQDVVAELSDRFYEPRGMAPGAGPHLFEARPGAGASVKRLADQAV
jgi:galactokinase